jgi:hypothetical protein
MNILPAGHPGREKLDSIRGEIVKVGKEIIALDRAPCALEEARARLRAALQREIDAERLNLERFRSRTANPSLPTLLATGGTVVRGALRSELVAIFGFEKYFEALAAPLAELDAARPGISEADRKTRHAELTARLVDLGRREELETLALEEERWVIVRRGDADPRLVLAIWREHRPETVDA